MKQVNALSPSALQSLCSAQNCRKFGSTIAAALNQLACGESLSRQQLLELACEDLKALCAASDLIRAAFCGKGFALCAIAAYKSGRCSENCRFCAQSALQQQELETKIMSDKELLQAAAQAYLSGLRRFSVVLTGRELTPGQSARLCAALRLVKTQFPELQLCASAGLSSPEALKALKQAGVTRLHCNLESSERFFPKLCQSHSWHDKIKTLQAARQAGLELCSGALFGAGESMEDRIDLGLTLSELGIKSVPVNLLVPIPGTPLHDAVPLSYDEALRSIALLRFILPDARLRLAGGRVQLPDQGIKAMQSGINAMIAGSMLTLSGPDFAQDLALTAKLNFVPVP